MLDLIYDPSVGLFRIWTLRLTLTLGRIAFYTEEIDRKSISLEEGPK
jgi:hypothetical protein